KAKAHVRIQRYKIKVVVKLYDRGVHPRGVELADLVLQKIKINNPIGSQGKLVPNREWSHRVIKVIRDGCNLSN
ncbi:hypothetical protein GW17_00027064, partial [Ensete ventricosum]